MLRIAPMLRRIVDVVLPRFVAEEPPQEFVTWVAKVSNPKKNGKYLEVHTEEESAYLINELAKKPSGDSYYNFGNQDRPETREILPRIFAYEKTTSILGVHMHLFNRDIIHVISNLRIHELDLTCFNPIILSFTDCWIGRFRISTAGVATVCLTIDNSMIGCVDLLSVKIQELKMKDCWVLLFDSLPFADSPFVGRVDLRNVSLPRKDGFYKGQRPGHQPWTNMRLHLQRLGDIGLAGTFQSVELTMERKEESAQSSVKFISYLYEFCSDYGNSITAPIKLLVWSMIIAFSFYLLTDGAESGADRKRLR